jgi:hypothetical protein
VHRARPCFRTGHLPQTAECGRCVTICLPVRHHLPKHRGLRAADLRPSGRLASSFAYTADCVRRAFRPMRRDFADSASTFAEPTRCVMIWLIVRQHLLSRPFLSMDLNSLPRRPYRVAHNVPYVKSRRKLLPWLKKKNAAPLLWGLFFDVTG